MIEFPFGMKEDELNEKEAHALLAILGTAFSGFPLDESKLNEFINKMDKDPSEIHKKLKKQEDVNSMQQGEDAETLSLPVALRVLKNNEYIEGRKTGIKLYKDTINNSLVDLQNHQPPTLTFDLLKDEYVIKSLEQYIEVEPEDAVHAYDEGRKIILLLDGEETVYEKSKAFLIPMIPLRAVSDGKWFVVK